MTALAASDALRQTAELMPLAVTTPGRVAYADALAWQEARLAECLAGGEDRLILLEHPPVYTLGRGADAGFLGEAAGGAIPVERVGRGGQVTYHGPGQLVGYPILDLRRHRQDVRWYVRQLESVMIDSLVTVGIRADRMAGRPGVWVGGRKIGSIGVAIRRWVTWHGFALNVSPDLSGFARIVPCGLDGVQMTSVAREGGPAEVEVMLPIVRDAFVATFGFSSWAPTSMSPSAPEVHA